MKEGAGENPFADESTEPSDDGPDTSETVAAETPEQEDEVLSESEDTDTFDIPYKFRRNSVQDGRERYPLFLMQETRAAEREALNDLENQFGASVSKTDLREALVKIGLQNLDNVEAQLRDWGYGIEFE